MLRKLIRMLHKTSKRLQGKGAKKKKGAKNETRRVVAICIPCGHTG